MEGLVMGNKLSDPNFRIEIEQKTGFVAYEKPGAQTTWYGLSTKLDQFKLMVKDYIPTGTIAYCIDTKSYQMWSKFDTKWY